MKFKTTLLLLVVLLLVGCTDIKSIQENKLTNAIFTCENDNDVQSRGYILLMGLGGHHKEEWNIAKKYMEMDPKAKFVVIYDQDEATHLKEISENFLSDMHEILVENPVDELVMFGSSAGGVTSSYSIAKLNFSGQVALHTLASPLHGYGFNDVVLGDKKGFVLDIARGLPPFDAPGDNVKVYHHKTVKDTVLVDYYCNGVTFLCNAIEIQNNNVPGSKEFFYPEYDHDTIMPAVIKKVLKCYNGNLSFPTEVNPEVEQIGIFCAGVEECTEFCLTSRGQCLEYCANNADNSLCKNPRIVGEASDLILGNSG